MSVERPPIRRTFPTDRAHAPLLRLLMVLDGSTTRVCEALARAPVRVQVHHQQRTGDVPDLVRDQLGGSAWLERVTSLSVDGEVMMDNVSFTRLDAVPADFLRALDAGQAPIGYLLQKLFVQRERLPAEASVAQRLWQRVGEPDARASRCYRIVTATSPLMLIFETFRGGMVRHDRS